MSDDAQAAEAFADLPFEGAIARLGEIAERLEDEELPLDEALALYEQGVALARHCRGILDRAERRIQLLGDDGSETPLDEPS